MTWGRPGPIPFHRLAHSADDEVVFTTLVDKTFDPSGPVAIQEMRMDTNGETLFVGANLRVVAIALAS